MVKAVIFDMDGLMFDTEALNIKGWIDSGTKHGYVMTKEIVKRHIGTNLDMTRRIMLEHFGADFEFDIVRAGRISYSNAHIKEHGTPLKAGLIALLAWLREKKIKTAVATSSERSIFDFYMANTDLNHNFDAVITGDMVKKSKPEPDIFLKAASELGVQPETCMVLEDSYHGIKAAYAAKMMPVMIPDILPPTPEVSALLFAKAESLKDVSSLIESTPGLGY